MSSRVVGRVDLLNSIESSDVSKFISGGDHKIGDTLPGGWGDIDSSVDESLVAFENESGDLDSEEGWDDDTGFEKGIECSNVGIGVGLEFLLERSSGNSGKLGSESTDSDITDVGGREGTEDGSIIGRNLSDGLDVV